MSDDALARERRGAAVLLAPARSDDPCPMTVIEALADGLPVLGSDRGGLPELVGADAALPVDDPAAWSAALTRPVVRPRRPRRRRRRRARPRARERHSPDAWYAGLMGVYGRRGRLAAARRRAVG